MEDRELPGPREIAACADARCLIEVLNRRAIQRDVAAEERDARAREVDDRLADDPAAYTAIQVATMAALDRFAAGVDRDDAAEDWNTLLELARGASRSLTATW